MRAADPQRQRRPRTNACVPSMPSTRRLPHAPMRTTRSSCAPRSCTSVRTPAGPRRAARVGRERTRCGRDDVPCTREAEREARHTCVDVFAVENVKTSRRSASSCMTRRSERRALFHLCRGAPPLYHAEYTKCLWCHSAFSREPFDQPRLRFPGIAFACWATAATRSGALLRSTSL